MSEAAGYPSPPAASWPLWAAAAGMLAARVLIGPLLRLQRETGWIQLNWRGEAIPASLGFVFPVAMLVGVIGADWGSGPWPAAHAGLLVLLSAALVGLFDDGARDAVNRGWQRHLTALLQGRWTSGSLKLLGISVGSIAAAANLHPRSFAGLLWVALAAAVIASTANAINLMDTRPGRALKFSLLLAVAVGLGDPQGAAWLFPVAAMALILLPVDLGGRAMLGDVGANSLGAALGFGLVLTRPEAPALLFALFLLVAFQVLGDQWSIGRLLEGSSFLSWLDRLGSPGLSREQVRRAGQEK